MNAAGLNFEIQVEISFILRALITRARSDHLAFKFWEIFPHVTGVSIFAGDSCHPGMELEDKLDVQLVFVNWDRLRDPHLSIPVLISSGYRSDILPRISIGYRRDCIPTVTVNLVIGGQLEAVQALLRVIW